MVVVADFTSCIVIVFVDDVNDVSVGFVVVGVGVVVICVDIVFVVVFGNGVVGFVVVDVGAVVVANCVFAGELVVSVVCVGIE